MNIVSTEMVEFTQKELTSIVMRLVNITEEAKAKQISNEIAEVADWNNSALMHKGLSWMTRNYLMKKDII